MLRFACLLLLLPGCIPEGPGEDGDLDAVAACVPGRAEECACEDGRRGNQVCGDDGRFGACRCAPGAADGARDGAARPPADAGPGVDRGVGGDGGAICSAGSTEIRPCGETGLNGGGAERRTCVEGAWSAWSACQDPDVCVVGAEQTEACGAGERGARRRVCLAGQWARWSACEGGEPECAGGAVETEACGRDGRGERGRRCQDGLWTPFGPCVGGCPDPALPDCSPPRAEVCNGIDDDQDGAVDEGLVADGPGDDPLTPFETAVGNAIARGVQHIRDLEGGTGHIRAHDARHSFLAVLVMLGQRSTGARGPTLGFEGLPPDDQAMVRRLLAVAIDGDAAARSLNETPYTYASGGNLAALTAYLASGGPDDVGAAVGAAAAAAHLTANLLETQGALAPGNLGGWNYHNPTARGDLSTTHYGAMGLASVDGTEEALRAMQPFLTSVIQADGGMGYNATSASSSSMTAVGLWLLRLSGLSADDPRVVGALDWLAEHYLYDDMVGDFRPTATYIYLWYLTKALAVSVAPNDPRFAVRRPAALGFPETPAGHYFDVAYTLLSWQDAEGAWGTGEAGSPSPGWTRESSHAFALLTLMQALVELGPAGVPPGDRRPACADGVDNDSDGRIDEADPDCLLPCGTTERAPAACANGVDDDGDGRVDYPADAGCEGAGDGSEEDGPPPRACSNGVDDDDDGRIDWPDDPQCSAAADDDEDGGPVPARCGDGVDNDLDGRVDLDDPGCVNTQDDDERDPPALPACANAIDDDADGQIDWPDDAGCAAAGDGCEQARYAVCDGACVDVQSDAARCGACDVVCDEGVECIDGTCGGLYRFEGVRRAVPDVDLLGWRRCHSDLYSEHTTRVDALVADCDGAFVMLGCRPMGSATWSVLAMGDRREVFTDTGSGRLNARTSHAHNGVEWYFSNAWSIGFAPGGEVVDRNSCDLEDGRRDERLCWHTRAGALRSGYRCGAWTGPDGQQTYERAVWTSP